MATTLDVKEVSPRPLYQLALGFAATKTLLAAHRLNFFKTLESEGKTADQVAMALGFPFRSTEMLLDSCVSLQLCSKENGVYMNSPMADAYLLSGKRGYLGRFLDHFNDHMYPAWFHLEEAVQTGHAQIQRILGEKDAHFFQAIDQQPQDLETFMATMEEHSLLEGKALAEAYDFSSHRALLDVGGGTGAMDVAIHDSYPHLQLTVFDRPPVCAIADKSIAQHQKSGAIRTIGGNFFADALPIEADILLLSGILHNWSPMKGQEILLQCRKAMQVGDTLLISEQILNEQKTEPLVAALCSLNMLVMMEGGQEYSQTDYEAFLSSTGFQLVEVRRTGSLRDLLIARAV